MRNLRAVIAAARGVNILLMAGGLALAVWQSLAMAHALGVYDAAGGYAENDVTRGYSIGVIGGIGITLLAGTALLGVRSGQRWGCWIDALVWLVMWFPAGVGLSMYISESYAVAGVVCSVGIVVAIVTYYLLPVPTRHTRDLREAAS